MGNDLRLVSHHLCPYVQRSIITLDEKGIEHDRVYVDLSNKPGWFLKISPLGKVPLLRVGDEVLFESAVICEYLNEITAGDLHPRNPLVKARHRAWIEFASSILDAIAGFYNAGTEDAFEAARLKLVERFEWLERNLGDGPYFAGTEFSLVDAAFGPVFRYFDVFERIGEFGFFAEAPRVTAWREVLSKRPSVRKAVAEDYPERLFEFLQRHGSHLSSLIED